MLLKAKEYQFRVFIDPHQDVWSRLTGGSGAPGWTLDIVGFDARNFAPTNAALVQNTYPDPKHFPKMIWATNYYKLAAATMFTLFFAGKTFAPKCVVDGVNIQDYLQSHYINAIAELANAIHDTPGLEDNVVVGYDTLNEPGNGFIGFEDITKIAHQQELKNGLTPTPLQTMVLGNGHACKEVQVWGMGSFGPQAVGVQNVDPKGIRAWKEGFKCIWAQHGVWDPINNAALIPDYFTKDPATQKPFDFLSDAWLPFVRNYSAAIRSIHLKSVIFIEPPVNAYPPKLSTANGDPSGPICFAPHWYDGLTLIYKHFNPWFNLDYIGYIRGKYSNIVFAIRIGEEAARSAYRSQLRQIRKEGEQQFGDYPCIIGEIGIPFDLDDKKAYLTGDYSAQVMAMDYNLSALERNLLNFTLWNYCSDNSNLWGDRWNGEDLSIWSPPIAASIKKEIADAEEQVRSTGDIGSGPTADGIPPRIDRGIKKVPKDLNAGARALEAFVRPYPLQTPGTPISLSFDMSKTEFAYTFSHALNSDGLWEVKGGITDFESPSCVTEIYIPLVHYGSLDDINVTVSDGTWRVYLDQQRLIWRCGCGAIPAAASEPTHTAAAPPVRAINSIAAIAETVNQVSPTKNVARHTICIRSINAGSVVAVNGDMKPSLVKPSDEDDESALCPQCVLF